MKTILSLLLASLVLSSCDKEDLGFADSIKLSALLEESCDAEHEDDILDIIEKFINEESSYAEYQYILRADHNGDLVFIFGNCNPFANSLPPAVYNCSGDYLGRIDYFENSREELSVSFDEISNQEVFWPEESKCRF